MTIGSSPKVVKPKTVDVDYEIFWRQVGQAVAAVELDTHKEMSIQVGSRKADVSWAEWESDEPPYEGVQIEVYEVETKAQPDTLIVP